MMISVWTNPTAIFILIGAQTTEQSQVKHELSFCARVLLGNIRRMFLLKNLGYWNAYHWYSMDILGSGYLNKFDGPCGCRNISFASLVSLQTSSTQANHRFSSCQQVTNPAINSGETSFFARATLSFLKKSDYE